MPGGLRNVVGVIPGKGKAIVLAAHYDTKDLPGFVGANDGAGGTAAMLELARGLQKAKRGKNAPPIWFVAFDGEEATDDNDFLGTGVRGAKAFAKKHGSKIKELVLLDFVANKNLAIPYEQSIGRRDVVGPEAPPPRTSAPSDAFPDTQQGTVEDDHTPFVQRGIPADRPDRLQLPLLAPDLRRPLGGLEDLARQERRDGVRVPYDGSVKTLYTAVATATDQGRGGSARSDDGRLDVQLSSPKAMGGDDGPGTNPEQLFAAGYAACFSSALGGSAARDGDASVVEGSTVTAHVGIGALGKGRFGLDGAAGGQAAQARAGQGRGARRPRPRALPLLERDPRQRRGHARRHRQLRIAAAERSTSSRRGGVAGDRDAQRVAAVPDGAAEPAGAVLLDARDRLRLAGDQHLVERRPR